MTECSGLILIDWRSFVQGALFFLPILLFIYFKKNEIIVFYLKIFFIIYYLLKCISLWQNIIKLNISFGRCVMLELAAAIVRGADEDLIDLIYKFVKFSFQVSCLSFFFFLNNFKHQILMVSTTRLTEFIILTVELSLIMKV